ncbi:MAG: DUF1566 domain-containing protein [Magnetococcales bacterium]|nr:DUF1566 domain-containing protein [Magnetococcales bacterium]
MPGSSICPAARPVPWRKATAITFGRCAAESEATIIRNEKDQGDDMTRILMNRAGWIGLIMLCVAVVPEGWADEATGPVRRSGQINTFRNGDDGATQKGVEWPADRFLEYGDGTVFDRLTGLIWMKKVNCFGALKWAEALDRIAGLNAGTHPCSGEGYEIGTYNDWRLPNIRELQSLLDAGRLGPSLPEGHPFSGLDSVREFWSGTTVDDRNLQAWYLNFLTGETQQVVKSGTKFVWPVRAGQR